MKVRELFEALSNADLEAEVILQKDAEGNGYSPMEGADIHAVYVAETTWSGIAYNINDSADDNGLDNEEWEPLKRGPRCVVLFPVN